MTIDELLKIAQENIGYARLTNTMDQAERGICAASEAGLRSLYPEQNGEAE